MLFDLNYHHEIEIQSNTNVDIRFHGIWPLRSKIWTAILKILRKSILFKISYMEIIPCVLTLAKITLKKKSKRAWTIVLCRFNCMPKVYGFNVIVVQSLNKVGCNGKKTFLRTRNVNCILHERALWYEY